jgi:rubrerythrin
MSTYVDGLVSTLEQEARTHQKRLETLARQAWDTGHPQADKVLRAVVAAERARTGLYTKFLVDQSALERTPDYYICVNCGLALTEHAPDECPLCHTPGARFEQVG